MRPADVIGRSRRERGLTLGTVAFALLAIAAFIALDSPDADSPEGGGDPDPVLLALDRECVETKRQLRDDLAGKIVEGGTDRLIQSIRSLQMELRSGRTGADDQVEGMSGAEELDRSLGDLRAAILDLDAAIAGGQTADVQAAIAATNAAATTVDQRVASMGLERCSKLRLAPA